MTESEQAAAILAAINAAIQPGATAYEPSKVPGANGNEGSEPTRYVTVDLTRRYTSSRRASGVVTLPGRYLTTRYLAKNEADVRNLRRLVTGALEDQILTSPAGEIGPFIFDTEKNYPMDEGYVVSDDVWTFC